MSIIYQFILWVMTLEKGTNNDQINKDDQLNNQQMFFIQRWFEILNFNTHSTYSIRYLNVHQALKEINLVCDLIIKDEVKNTQHLKLVIEETNSIMHDDDVFQRRATAHFNLLQNTFNSLMTKKNIKMSNVYAMKYQVTNTLNHIADQYLKWLVSELKGILDKEEINFHGNDNFFAELKTVDTLIGRVISELVGNGWSVKSLYKLGKGLIKEIRRTETDTWDKFLGILLKEKEMYTCFFPIENDVSSDFIRLLKKVDVVLFTGEQINNLYPDLLTHHISNKRNYIQVEIVAFDKHSAINLAWEEMLNKLDVLQFYGHDIPSINKQPIIVFSNGKRFERNHAVSLSYKKNYTSAPSTIFENAIHLFSQKGDKDVIRKIRSVFEFSRISHESLSPQSTFINLWIALETFLNVSFYEGEMENIREIGSAVLSNNYIYSLIRNFYEDCNRCNVGLFKETEAPSGDHTRAKVSKLVEMLTDEQEKERIMQLCVEKNVLLAYRCFNFINLLQDGKRVAEAIENHQNRVKQHLQRLYRIRNMIVHSGSSDYNLGLFIKHLDEYIEITMSTVIHRLMGSKCSITDVFSIIRDNVDATVEILRNSKHMDRSEYRNLLLEGAF